MPLRLPDKLPAIELLKRENIFVMDNSRAISQDIRPLKIVILNLMPLKITTETDLVRLLSNTPLQLDISFMKLRSHTPKNTPIEHMMMFYRDFEEIIDEKFDGMIVTGAPVETYEYEDVTYWNEMKAIFAWARSHVTSTLYICWAAQAGLYFHYGIPKYPLKKKMFGIFREYQSWVEIMGVPTVGAVNSKVLAGDAGGMIKLAEAFHERKFAWVADEIYRANLTHGTRMVLISGPSSSGKTTSPSA